MKLQNQNDRGDHTWENKNQDSEKQCEPACPACGGSLISIRAKLQCSKCHRICETCCEGGRG